MPGIIPLNSKIPPKYRIGKSNRTIGAATGAANGFAVLNQTTGKVFIASGGVWTDGGTFPFPTTSFDFPQLFATWFGTNSTNLNTDGMRPSINADGTGAITGGLGYRIGNSDRIIGAATTSPNGFYVFNRSNGKVFKVISGVWAAVDSLPVDLYAAWLQT
jgi:hypothetical protein